MDPIERSQVDPSAVLDMLEAGTDPETCARACGLAPGEWTLAMCECVLGADPGPSLVQARPARPRLVEALSEPALEPLFPRAARTARLGLAAGLLQIHDFWEQSHHAAQLADDLGERRISAYWHAIAHRREPDPGNSAYWFRRVGQSPVFDQLALAIADLSAGDAARVKRVVSGGRVDPFRMIDLCGAAATDRELEPLARRLQRLEMRMLLAETLLACG